MVWIIAILGIGLAIFLSGCKKPVIPEPNPKPDPPDPHGWKWQKRDISTESWKRYVEGMKYIISDALMASELKKKDKNGKPFYRWVSDWDLFHKLDYWDTPNEVWERGTCDCDGFAALTSDGLGRFVQISEVWWLEYYGYYRKYEYDSETGEYSYKVVAAGHAITVYKKDDKLLAFSNTSWWNNQNFQDFIEIGEQTFPEGLYFV